MAVGMRAGGLGFADRCSLVTPLPGASVLPASASVCVGDYSVCLAVAVSGHG
jgi:hypothetical protein